MNICTRPDVFVQEFYKLATKTSSYDCVWLYIKKYYTIILLAQKALRPKKKKFDHISNVFDEQKIDNIGATRNTPKA